MTDLWILWEWPFDAPFVEAVASSARAAGLSMTSIGPQEARTALDRIRSMSRAPAVVLDRASDVLPEAADIAILARRRGAVVLNDPDRVPAAVDKVRMHLALMSVGVEVPWTVVAPALEDAPGWPRDQLPRIGAPFVIKPAHGAGGEGVVLDATREDDVDRARAERPAEAHLLQEFIRTAEFGGRPAYFRALYCLGEVHPCFWDPVTRHYALPRPDDLAASCFEGIAALAEAVARVAGMALFSTEIAQSPDGRLVAVDYVNDMCDLRLASQHPDGIPDAVVRDVARRIVQVAVEVARGRRGP